MNALYEYAIAGGLPPFDKITADHVVPTVRKLLEELETTRVDIEKTLEPTWDGAIERINDAVEPMERAWGVVSHLMGVKNSPELREGHKTVQPEVVAAFLRLGQSKPLFDAMRAIREGPRFSELTPQRQRILEKKLLEMRLSGIALPESEQKTFLEISQELSDLSTKFSNNVLDATKAWAYVTSDREEIAGLPPTALAMACPENPEQGPWKITLDFPMFDAVMRHGQRRDLRERVYRAYVARASELDAEGKFDNRPLMERILTLRIEKAKLLGFQTYAELSLATKMAPAVDEVERLLEELRKTSRPVAEQELKELEKLAGHTVAHWDVPYWAERLREQRYAFSEEELRPYFPLPRVLEGLFALTTKLFGVTVEEATSEVVRWHDDVRYFKIKDDRGFDIASFFLDPYARPAEKRGGAWMDDCVTRRRVAHETRLPVAYLCCNQTPPTGGKPSLMTFREVETLFHEFGHGLQHMLTLVDDVDASGIRGIEWDAVELPSQFMENWCTHRQTVLGMAKHVDTGAPLPDELFQKVKAAKTFRAASMMLRQLAFAMLDLELHSRYAPAPETSVFQVQRKLAPLTSVLPPLNEDRFLCSFSHIFAGGYAAGYYSYKWAEVLSADAFAAFEEAGLDDDDKLATTGRRFKDTVLALGGSVHPGDVFKQFRGRPPSTDALLRHAGLVNAEVR